VIIYGDDRRREALKSPTTWTTSSKAELYAAKPGNDDIAEPGDR